MTDSATCQLLLIANDAELYGIEVPRVQEIRAYQSLTRLPHAPDYVLGVLNVSGQIVPVIDLRCRLWGRPTVVSAWHVIILVKSGDMQCGILVDNANEIAAFTKADIEPMPLQANSGCLAGIVNFNGSNGGTAEPQSIAVLDIEAIAHFSLGSPGFEPVEQKEISYV